MASSPHPLLQRSFHSCSIHLIHLHPFWFWGVGGRGAVGASGGGRDGGRGGGRGGGGRVGGGGGGGLDL